MTDVRAGEPGGRPLSIPMFIGLVVVYLVVVQGVGLLLAPDGADYGELPDSETVRTTIVIPVALSLLLTAAAVSYLRWWRPVMRDDRPTRRWVLIVPVLLLVAILLTVNYGNLADQDIELVLLLALGTLLVGVTEELMFRGIGVVTFRRAGLTEVKVALWSSLVFGAVHATNIFTEGQCLPPGADRLGHGVLLLPVPPIDGDTRRPHAAARRLRLLDLLVRARPGPSWALRRRSR